MDHRAVAREAVQAVDQADDVLVRLAAFSDPTRLRLLFAVHAAPGSSISALAEATSLSPNTVTQAMTALRQLGLVHRSRQGRHSAWTISDDAAHELLHHLGATHSPLHPPHDVSRR